MFLLDIIIKTEGKIAMPSPIKRFLFIFICFVGDSIKLTERRLESSLLFRIYQAFNPM
jgi:hypothetical protein